MKGKRVMLIILGIFILFGYVQTANIAHAQVPGPGLAPRGPAASPSRVHPGQRPGTPILRRKTPTHLNNPHQNRYPYPDYYDPKRNNRNNDNQLNRRNDHSYMKRNKFEICHFNSHEYVREPDNHTLADSWFVPNCL